MFSAVQAEIFPSDLCCKAGWLILDILQDTRRGERELLTPGAFNPNCNAWDLESTESPQSLPAETGTGQIILDLKCQHSTDYWTPVKCQTSWSDLDLVVRLSWGSAGCWSAVAGVTTLTAKTTPVAERSAAGDERQSYLSTAAERGDKKHSLTCRFQTPDSWKFYGLLWCSPSHRAEK